MESQTKLVGITPTVFFKREGEALHHLVRVQIAGVSESADKMLRVRAPGIESKVVLEAHGIGEDYYGAYIPDIRAPGEVIFELLVGGHVADRHAMTWTPQRHWEVYLVHYAHHDLGYTDLPSNVLREYDAFYDDILRFCDETAGWHDSDARFRYLVEQAWSLLHYVEHRPPELVEQLMAYVRSGHVEVTALFGNQTLELCGHEELVRLLYPAFALAKRYGFEITSAEHNDIPGFPWALASVLRGAGIRHFSPGVPAWYFGAAHPLWDTEDFLPLNRPAACWWEGPDGSQVLLWSDMHGREWQPYDAEQAHAELPEMLEELVAKGYPYDMVSYTLRGGHRDNAPPTLRYAHMAREWNARWSYPRLINATNRIFLERFETRWGETLPHFRGDVPGTDYPVAATCTPKETGLNRVTHDRLRAAEALATLASEVARHVPNAPDVSVATVPPAGSALPQAQYAYPRASLEQAWHETFTYDLHCWGFHDVGGPAQDAHWAEKALSAYRAAALAHDVATKAINRLADAITYPEEGYYLTVFNTLGHVRSAPVWAPLRLWDPCGSPMYWTEPDTERAWPAYVSGTGPGRKLVRPPADLLEHPFHLVDIATGKPLPYQIVDLDDARAAQPWAPERAAQARMAANGVTGSDCFVRQLVFVAHDLPAMGYRTYRLEPCAAWPDFQERCQATLEGLESPYYRVTFNSKTGALFNILDKEEGHPLYDTDVAHPPGAVLVRDSASGEVEVATPLAITALEAGPVFARARVLAHASCAPQITQEILIYHDLKRVDTNYRILRDATPMQELYIAFPFQAPHPNFHYEAGNAVIKPLRDQVPGSNTDTYAVQHWVTVDSAEDTRDKDWGITWTPIDTPIVELGGLWPGYVSEAHHGVTGPGYGHPFLEEGELARSHIYALVSYNNFRTNFINARPDEYVVRYSFTSANQRGPVTASRFGWSVSHAPQIAWLRGPHVGHLPAASSLIMLHTPTGEEAGNVVLIALKRAEDGDGVILRLWETAGQSTEVVISAALWPLTRVFETNLVEENQQLLACDDGKACITLSPYALATLRIGV